MRWLQSNGMIHSGDLSSAGIYLAAWLHMTVVHLHLVFNYSILFKKKKKVKMWLCYVNLGNQIIYPDHLAGN